MPLTDMGVNERNVPISYLYERLSYDKDSGTLRWKEGPENKHPAWDKKFKGKLVGSIRKDGYWGFSIDLKVYKVHRVIWAMETGSWPENEIDHINGNRSDNRFENLRSFTRVENARNKSLSKANKSGYPGVIPVNGRWNARISSGSLRVSKTFDTYREALEHRMFLELEAGYSFDRWKSEYGLSF